MGVFAQLAAIAVAPLAFGRLRWRSILWLLIYTVLAGGILAALATFLITHQGRLRDALLGYLFLIRGVCRPSC